MNGLKRLATSGRSSVRGCHGPTAPRGAPSGGFTLVELLIVITIIGILAGLALSALTAARTSARITKTKSTIAKLDLLVQGHCDSYRTRRVTIYNASSGARVNPNSLGNPYWAARVRTRAIRDLMRMEMPERWEDIVVDPAVSPPAQYGPVSSGGYTIKAPSLANRYFRKFVNTRPSGDYTSGECLYMWLTSCVPDAREKFADNEIGDADGDGWPEFQDGWGNPIKFLRWAPAFLDSDIQPVVFPIDDSVARRAASEADHDPFDQRKLDIDVDPGHADYGDLPPRGGWRLIPLIYSAGPDGIYGINYLNGYSYQGNPFFYATASPPSSRADYEVVLVGGPVAAGSANAIPNGPKETASGEDYLDNIHNHREEVPR